jgi:hypothetical protein
MARWYDISVPKPSPSPVRIPMAFLEISCAFADPIPPINIRSVKTIFYINQVFFI